MKKRLTKLMAIVLSAVIFAATPVQTQAATESTTTTQAITGKDAAVITLKKNTNIRYDFNGDDKRDTMRYTISGKTLTITLNGTTVYTTADADNYTVKFCRLENGRFFINIAREWSGSDWQASNRLYRFKSGKLVYTNSLLATATNRYQTSRSTVTSVKGNDIYVRYTGMTNVTGKFMWTGIYRYVSGYTTKRVSSTMDAYYSKKIHTNSWTVNKTFRTYKKVNSTKKAFTVKANEKVKIDKVYSKKDCLWFKITRANGTSGWLKSPKTTSSMTRYFKNITLSNTNSKKS